MYRFWHINSSRSGWDVIEREESDRLSINRVIALFPSGKIS
jgi:hypothetical protein